MNARPSVSVIIPSYNCARFVTDAVDSVLAQTSPPDEIIVVDDGSTDDTAQCLAPYMDRIRYVHQQNGGISSARNRGIQQAQGTLIAFIDADDRWLPDKLEKQLAYLAAHPEVDLVHTDILYWDDLTGRVTHVPQDRARFVGRCYREFFWHCRVLTSSVLVTRRALEDAGPFDPTIPGGYAEDLDFFLRIARKYSFGFVAEPLVLYRRHGNNATSNAPRMCESAFVVFDRVLKNDAAMWEVLGPAAARDYLRHLAFVAGYAYAEAGNLPQARHYFRRALGYAPRELYLWLLWWSTFIPLPLRERLRELKQRLTPRRRPASAGQV